MRLLKIIFLLLSLVFILYLVLPLTKFPDPLPNSIKSQEPADLEEPNRVGFYTNLTREEVINFYKSHFFKNTLNIGLPFIRLNYPPEEAQEKIRDQTHSTFLEEIIHPFNN